MITADVSSLWPLVLAVVTVAVSLVATAHIVLRKRDTKAAIGWVGVVWLAPYLGTFLYIILGINRIRRKAARLRRDPAHPRTRRRDAHPRTRHDDHVMAGRTFTGLVENLTGLPLLDGNRITPLVNGEVAYPEMIAAIDGARETVALSTYIFDTDAAGTMFARALGAAADRGVEVRVLIDSMGARYSFPRMMSRLNRKGVRAAEFLHSFIPWRMKYLNLRNHRKILVVDGQTGFTGGMNIRAGHLVEAARANGSRQGAIRDIHFRVEGPVVAQLMEVFAEDWAFSTREVLSGDTWFPPLDPGTPGPGLVAARGVSGGPDERYDHLRWVLMAALAEARYSVRIMTPYFLPEDVTLAALNLAALSGIEIDILIPERGNLRMVQWASHSQLPQLLEQGARVWLNPPPFDHTKIMVVDDRWAFIGSANWDPRSLFLNFEFNLECHGASLARDLGALFEARRAQSRPLTLADLASRSLPVKLRDGAFRLLSPYL